MHDTPPAFALRLLTPLIDGIDQLGICENVSKARQQKH